jgi:cell division septal protein FtsQ
MEDSRFGDPHSAKVSVGYLSNDGRRRRLLSPHRTRLCSRRRPSRSCKRGGRALLVVLLLAILILVLVVVVVGASAIVYFRAA